MVTAVRFAGLLVGALLSAPACGIDPTAPPPMAVDKPLAAGAGGHLTWVRVGGHRAVAWYNGTVVQIGDTINGERLVEVREDHIVLFGAQGARRVYLLDPRLRAQRSTGASPTVRR